MDSTSVNWFGTIFGGAVGWLADPYNAGSVAAYSQTGNIAGPHSAQELSDDIGDGIDTLKSDVSDALPSLPSSTELAFGVIGIIVVLLLLLLLVGKVEAL